MFKHSEPDFGKERKCSFLFLSRGSMALAESTHTLS